MLFRIQVVQAFEPKAFADKADEAGRYCPRAVNSEGMTTFILGSSRCSTDV